MSESTLNTIMVDCLMDELSVTVTVEYKDGAEKEIEVYINLDDFADLD